MNRSLSYIFGTILCVLILWGCESKEYTSWVDGPLPIEVRITVSDNDGNNMLDPTKTSNISSNVISAAFLGSTYLRDSSPKNGISLWTMKDANDEPHVLVFGQISGSRTLENIPLVIDWGDGTSDTITIYNKYSWSMDKAPVLERHIIYDGQDYYGKQSVQVTR